MENNQLSLTIATIDSYLDVQAILDSAEYYYMKVEGVPKLENAAKEVFESLPPNSTPEDKFVFFIEFNKKRIGVVDLVFGYPTKDVAFLGLLLLDQKFYGKGIGRRSYDLVEKFAKDRGASSIQLGVNDTNEIGMTFWKKLGFEPNGRTRLNEGVKIKSTVYVLERLIT